MRTLPDDELIATALASRPVVECHSESRDCAGCAHRGKARCRVPVLRMGHTVLPEITAKPGAAERGRTAGTKTMASRVDRLTDGRDAMNAQRKIDAETRVKGLLAAFDADPTWECLARLAAADGLRHESVCKKLRPFRDLPSSPNHGHRRRLRWISPSPMLARNG